MSADRRVRLLDLPPPQCALDLSPEDFDAVALLDEPAPAAVEPMPDIPVIVLLLPWWPA